MGAPILISHHGDCREICGIQPLRILTVMQKRGGTYNNQHMDLGRLSHTCCAHVLIPTSILLICRAKLEARSAQGTQWGANLPYLDPQTKSFVRPGVWLAHAQARRGVTAPYAVDQKGW